MEQLVQVVGALLILAAYAAAQFRVLQQDSYPYLVLNFAGSLILGVLAYWERQWGFFLLEAVWAVVSLWGLVAKARGRSEPAP
jgi:hypothetical protein